MGTIAKASKGRIEWETIQGRIDLASLTTTLLGPSAKRSGRRMLWCCPFHDDRNPSFYVDPASNRWKCWPCGLGGDAPGLLMKLRGLTFPEAVQSVAELTGIITPSTPHPPRIPVNSPSARKIVKSDRDDSSPTGLPAAEAMAMVERAVAELHGPDGALARSYLAHRGLSEATIWHHRLGWTSGVMLPTADGVRYWRASGVVIPWFDSGRLARVKIRQADGRHPRYAEAFSDRPKLYPCRGAIRRNLPVVVVEGELDAVLLGQELAGLANVLTLGSSSSRPDGPVLASLAACHPWFVALDADKSGDRASADWEPRAIRVRPPAGKDWTEARLLGIDLRRWWVEQHFPAAFDAEERASILEFDGGLSREEAEEQAGLALPLGGIPSRPAVATTLDDTTIRL